MDLTKDGTRQSPGSDPTAPTTLGGAARVAGKGMALWAGVQLAALLLERRPMALSVVQAALAEWGTGRLGVCWSDPLAPVATFPQIALRVGRGAALGGATAATTIAIAWLTGSATLTASTPSFGLLAVGLVYSALGAVQGELVLRGVVLRATRGLLPLWVALIACGAAAAAARFGVEGAAATVLAAEALRGIALGALWVRDRGAWMAWAANTSWTWTLGSLTHGGPVDVVFRGEPDGFMSTIAVVGSAALLASLWSAGRRPRAGLR